ncbi:MAG: hypothetical protein V5786_03230 [Psychromonas sp.]
MTRIQAKIERLLDFEKKLNLLLDEQDYELFLQQQDLFGDLLKDFLSKHSENELNNFIKQLKSLEDMVYLLRGRSGACLEKLKEKSLLLQRNKKKIKAYK